jgi:hypothetical protein
MNTRVHLRDAYFLAYWFGGNMKICEQTYGQNPLQKEQSHVKCKALW